MRNQRVERLTVLRRRTSRGAEIGWFGFGSTVIFIVAEGAPTIPEIERETKVLMGGAIRG